jgi:HAD superfamily hydrolase (TIGR01490 family)
VIGRARAARFQARFQRLRRRGVAREDINLLYYLSFRGRRPEVVRRLAGAWFARNTADPDRFYVPETLRALREHQSAGVEIVFVSGSMMEIVGPIAAALGVQYILATRAVVFNNRYTGGILPPQTIGSGKAQAVRDFLVQHRVDAQTCWAYADDISDIPMLAAVGHPVVVSKDPTMVRAARHRGWPVLLGDPAALDRSGGTT